MTNTSEQLRLRLLLPTWNQILSMDLRRRMRTKKFIRDFVFMSIANAGGSQTPMGFTARPPWMESFAEDYSQMIRQPTSKASRYRKNLRKQRKRSSKSGR